MNHDFFNYKKILKTSYITNGLQVASLIRIPISYNQVRIISWHVISNIDQSVIQMLLRLIFKYTCIQQKNVMNEIVCV